MYMFVLNARPRSAVKHACSARTAALQSASAHLPRLYIPLPSCHTLPITGTALKQIDCCIILKIIITITHMLYQLCHWHTSVLIEPVLCSVKFNCVEISALLYSDVRNILLSWYIVLYDYMIDSYNTIRYYYSNWKLKMHLKWILLCKHGLPLIVSGIIIC